MRILNLAARNIPLVALLAFTCVFAAFLLKVVIWPAYQKPSNRTYDSKFGHSALSRKLGLPATVETATVQIKSFVTQQLGEGRVAAEPIRVPIIPTDRIVSIAGAEGDRVVKGQLLAELDATQARLRLESAKLLVANAKAELERVRLGSEYTLSQERPEREGINLQASKKQIEILRERHTSMTNLYNQGSASRLQLLELESQLAEAERTFQTTQLSAAVSERGQVESTSIAENNLQQQENLLSVRIAELAEYQVWAPADGILESVCVHPGEYNRTTGEVGFVIASGLWFEAHIDQTGIHKIAVGDKAEVQLEAFPGEPIEGSIARVVPIVTYSSTGPEGNRPVRALGTGAPEWPTTFKVIIDCISTDNRPLAPGLTGFARIESARDVPAVPLSAAMILSSRQGMVNVVLDGRRTTRRVTFGDTWKGWIEIVAGVSPDEHVAIAGHENLQAQERFDVMALTP